MLHPFAWEQALSYPLKLVPDTAPRSNCVIFARKPLWLYIYRGANSIRTYTQEKYGLVV